MDVCSQSNSDLSPTFQPAIQPNNTSAPLEHPLSRKQKRVEAAKKEKQIEGVLLRLGEQVDLLLQDAATELNVEAQVLTSRFLAARSAFHESRPTPWQGFVSKMSTAWKDEEDGGRKHKGAAYLNYVVKRIAEEGLYANLTPKEKEGLVVYAQELRNSKISAGSAKTVDKRLVQGNVKNELYAMADRLRHLHEITGLEAILIIVHGNSTDGLQPAYYASDDARRFLESHISVNMDRFLKLFELSCTSGAVGIAEESKMTRDKVKRLVRDALRASLCAAALSTASDGSGPTIQDADEISAITWTNYKGIVIRYKAVVYGWPMTPEGAMVDPSSVGGQKLLESYLNRITDKLNPTIGFRRLTHDEWTQWCDENNVLEDGLGRTRKVRSDKGKSRKIAESGTIISDAPKSLKRKSRNMTSNASKSSQRSKEKDGSSPGSVVTSNITTAGTSQPRPLAMEHPSSQLPAVDPTPTLASPNESTSAPSVTFDYSTNYVYPDTQVASAAAFPSSPFEFTRPSPIFVNTATSSNLSETWAASPTYPLVRVPTIQSQQLESANVAQPATSTASPGTPRATRTRRRRDPFIVMSPETFASRTPRPRHPRTGSVSSHDSRPSSPCPRPISSTTCNLVDPLVRVEPSSEVAPPHGSELPFGHIIHPALMPEMGLNSLTLPSHMNMAVSSFTQPPLTYTLPVRATTVVSLYSNNEFASPSE
ncbi:hypothetical protein FRC11_006782 [Ceratobasidium sp. 423]|nr:hypothetical protein FRC11_006782 [Ceratobasidium sp. 423]